MGSAKYVTIAAFFLIAISSLSYAYLPPVYIANPETGECMNYFAGDSKHYNPLPNGTWEMVGMSENNASYCQYSCFFNSNKFWQALLEITQNNMTAEDINLEYRVFTNLTCMCISEGGSSCRKWCDINNGILKNSSAGKYNCICPDGSWNRETGCSSATPTGNAIDFFPDYDIFVNLAVLCAGIALGYMIAKKVKAGMKGKSETVNKSENKK